MKNSKRTCAGTAVCSASDPEAGHCWPTPLLETHGNSQVSLVHSLLWILFLSPGSWCTQSLVCSSQESVSADLWKFCNQIPLASKVRFPGGSQSLCQIPRLGSIVGPGTFLTVWEFLWYNCSVVCGLSAQQLYGGVKGNLLQESLCCMLRDACLLQAVPLPPCQATHASTGDTQTLKSRSDSVSVGSLGPGAHKVLFEPSEYLWWVWVWF